MFILLASHQQIIVRTKALPSIGVVVILASVGVIVSVAVSKRSSRSSSTSDDAPRQYQQRYRLPRRQHGVDHPPSRPTTQVLRTRSQFLPLATGKQQLLEVPLFSVSDVRNCNDNDINAEDDEAESTCLKTIVSDINKEERTEEVVGDTIALFDDAGVTLPNTTTPGDDSIANAHNVDLNTNSHVFYGLTSNGYTLLQPSRRPRVR
ncbi:hypothetical protein F444_09447 [Phytophthora nicotianae P1976]|uniref:Uncharacterized protein n=1 Tax=Phytophthora nicotianae P1976 TaxID=1317066 RepID=A0A081A7Q0_PHYNI|nr:hypothetical protein F444_09447 [Phytophthora nicotianae P1976]